MKRLAALLAASALLAIALLGCGGQALPPIEPTTEPTTTTTTTTTTTETPTEAEEATTTAALIVPSLTAPPPTTPGAGTTLPPITTTTTTTAPQGPGGNPHTTPPAGDQGGPITAIRLIGLDRSAQSGGAWVLQQTRTGPDVEPQRQVIWQITPASARAREDFRVRSSNPSVVQAPWHGLLRGMSPGEAVITVYSVANPAIYDTIRVRVVAP